MVYFENSYGVNDHLRELIRHPVSKRSRGNKAFLTVIVIAYLLYSAYELYIDSAGFMRMPDGSTIFLCAVTLVLLLLAVMRTSRLLRRSRKRNREVYGEENPLFTISFGDRCITDKEGNLATVEIAYSQIERIERRKNYTILFIDKQRALQVFDDSFTVGNKDDFLAFINGAVSAAKQNGETVVPVMEDKTDGECVFVNEYSANREFFRRLYRHPYDKVTRRFFMFGFVLFVAFLALSVLYIVIGVKNLLSGSPEIVDDVTSLIIGAALLALAAAVMFRLRRGVIKASLKRNKSLFGSESVPIKLSFGEDAVTIREGTNLVNVRSYDNLESVEDCVWYYWLGFGKNVGLRVVKDGFVYGDPESFEKWIKSKISDKQ